MKKILVTLGPSSMSRSTIREIAEYKVSMFRINLSHTELKDLYNYINIIQSSTDIPVCLDSEGAQIRNRNMQNDSVYFEKDTMVKVHYEEVMGDPNNIFFTPEGIAKQFEVGDVIKIDFNLASMEIVEKNKGYCLARVITSGMVGSNKAVDISRDIALPPITEKDREAIRVGREMKVKNFALSFANTSEDVRKFRELVGMESNIISKIESRSGLHNLESIIRETDEILIDRGDLSRQIDIEKIPFLQRRIIAIARIMDKPVNVATNLLETMVNNRVPTRAEVNDIVSTILMGADGLVLAAETATGQHPVQAVKIVKNIIDLCKKWTTNTNISEILEM